MVTKQLYVECLISMPVNYTCTNLTAHLESTSHDAITDYLRRERQTARHFWELTEPIIDNQGEAHLIINDSVLDKRHSQVMELVKRQYSGNVHGLVQGIGIVNFSS